MPNDQFYVICPYYHKVLGNQLFCEGFSGDDKFSTDECRIKQCFSSREERNNFIEKYCSGFDYLRCSIATVSSLLHNTEGKNTL